MILRIKCTHCKVAVDEELKRSALSRITWEVPPDFKKPGRTAWLVLPQGGGTIKLKGVGLWNPASLALYGGVRGEGKAETPLPPSTRGYQQKALQKHFGFDDEGHFRMKSGAATPSGGMLHEKAVAEYENATRLVEHGIPSISPILVVEYTDLTFEGKHLGAVASYSPDQYPFGLESVLFYDVFNYPDMRRFFAERRECATYIRRYSGPWR